MSYNEHYKSSKIYQHPNEIQSQLSVISDQRINRDHQYHNESVIEVPLDLKEPIQFFWKQLNPKLKGKFKPIARQSSTFIEINKNLHLFGGLSHVLLNDHHILKTVSTSSLRGSRKSKRNQSVGESSAKAHHQIKTTIENANWFWHTVQINEKALASRNDESLRQTLSPIVIPTARCGHSASSLDGNKMVIFGGQQLFQKKINSRGCLNDVLIYNESLATWFFVKCQGIFIQGRRNHIGTVWGKNFFIFGGINSSGNTTNQTAMLDITQTKTWRPINIVNLNQGLGAIAFSASAIVDPAASSLGDQIRNITLLHKQEQIQIRGIYFFGGLRADGKASGKLLILRKYNKKGHQQMSFGIEKQNKNQSRDDINLDEDRSPNQEQKYQWHEPLVLGRGPPPRYGHCLVFLRPQLSAKSYLVVSGGRNDTRDNFDTTTTQEGIKCLDDLWVLDLTPKIIQNQQILMNYNKPEYAFIKKIKRIQNPAAGKRIITPPIWIRVSCFGSPPSPRHSHCAAEYNGKLLVFGGISQKQYCPSDVYVLQTQCSTVKHLKQLYAKYVAATAGVINSGDNNLTTPNIQPQNSNTFDWIDLNFSLQNEQQTLMNSKVQFHQLQREMFQKSLMQLVNNAFFQKDQGGGRSSIVKSMIIKNKLQDKVQPKRGQKKDSFLGTVTQKQKSVSKFSASRSGIIESNNPSPLPNNYNNNSIISSKLALINTSVSNLQDIKEQKSMKTQIKRSSTSANEFSGLAKKGLSSFVKKFSHIDQSSVKGGSGGNASIQQG